MNDVTIHKNEKICMVEILKDANECVIDNAETKYQIENFIYKYYGPESFKEDYKSAI